MAGATLEDRKTSTAFLVGVGAPTTVDPTAHGNMLVLANIKAKS